jgi:hypothetical protein
MGLCGEGVATVVDARFGCAVGGVAGNIAPHRLDYRMIGSGEWRLVIRKRLRSLHAGFEWTWHRWSVSRVPGAFHAAGKP